MNSRGSKKIIPIQWKDKYVCLKCETVNQPIRGGRISQSGNFISPKCHKCDKKVHTYKSVRGIFIICGLLGPIGGAAVSLVWILFVLLNDMPGSNLILQSLIIPIPIFIMWIIPFSLFLLLQYKKFNKTKRLLEKLNKIEGLAEDARITSAYRY